MHTENLGNAPRTHGAPPVRRLAIGVASTVIGLALAAAMATPASASPTPSSPSSQPPALAAWLATPTVTVAAAPARLAAAGGVSAALVSPATVVGRRIVFTRGGALAWSSDTFEWYWSGAAISSSTAWQADGYVFPNTVSLKGVARTLAIPSQHNWRASAAIGAGVATPWGTVNVYQATITDYFTLTPGGGYSHSS
jgi:hypothetical protein